MMWPEFRHRLIRQKNVLIDNPPDVVNGHRTEPPKESALLGVSLEIARGLAALFVFCFHIQAYIAEASPTLGSLARYGYMGVPIFFVISGYCMAASAHQVLRRNRSAGSFLRKRFLRIDPPFWASIIIIMVTPYLLEGLTTPDNPVFTLTLIGGTVAISLLFYLFFERPFISRRYVT